MDVTVPLPKSYGPSSFRSIGGPDVESLEAMSAGSGPDRILRKVPVSVRGHAGGPPCTRIPKSGCWLDRKLFLG